MREAEMRVVVYGRESTLQKITLVLAEEGVEVAGVSDMLYEMLGWHTNQNFDLAIADGQAKRPEITCRSIREHWNIPVVLMIDQKRANWKELQVMDADGYLQAETECCIRVSWHRSTGHALHRVWHRCRRPVDIDRKTDG